ncbi:MAG: Ribose-5-phosphate isomerase A [Methanomassiliicoccales archaeon PtaU1.Bin124]|nr:MAG: Ribose-5-phosphate isomerase A [Methanomassiliicoccales archaeon PtaU1.Bin124]
MSEKKRLAAERAVEFVQDGMVLGLGTGSTTYFAVEAIGRLVKQGWDLKGVPTSSATEEQARKLGIPLLRLDEVETIDLTIDGADEVDRGLDLIKGMGAALLREKMVAYISKQEVIIVDDSKIVKMLGTKSPLPIEVVQFGHERTRRHLEALGCRPELRGGGSPTITDNGNLIYNCRFESIPDPKGLETRLKRIPGVVETGLFLGMATKVVVAGENGIKIMER